MDFVALLLLVTPILTLPVIYLSTSFMLYLHNNGLARIRNGLRIQNLVFLFTWMQTQNEMLGLTVAATSGDTDIHIPTPSSFRWDVHDQDLNRNPGEARKLCDTISTNTNNKNDRADNIIVNECDGGALPT